MGVNRRLNRLYLALTAFIILLVSGAGSYLSHGNERDPFRFGSAHSPQPEHEPGENREKAVLQMILITDHHRIAVFNGREYRRGDLLGEYIVTDIEFNVVTVENGADKIFFTLHAE